MRQFYFCLSVLLVLQFTSVQSHAATITVKADGNGDQPNIQAAILAAEPGDSICLPDPLYTGDGNRDIDFSGAAVTIFSPSGDPASCIIDCEGHWTEPHFGFSFHSGEDTTSVLAGITIRNGWITGTSPFVDAPGITFISSSPKIINSRVTGCNGGAGGVSCDLSSPLMRNVRIDNNYTESGAGGLLCTDNSNPILTDCLIDSNFGPDVCEKAIPFHNGGAVTIQGNSAPMFIRCSILDNYTLESDGAGVSCDNSAPTFSECLIAGNYIDRCHSSSPRYGNGLDFFNSQPVLDGCVIFNNGHDYLNNITGGGVSARGGTVLTIQNSAIVGNHATNGPGGIYLEDSSLILRQTILAFNDAESFTASNPGSITLEYCNIFGNAAGDWVDPIWGSRDLNGNLNLDPLFCDPEDGDFTLRSDSPCLAHNHPEGMAPGNIGPMGQGCYPDAPHILSILDIGNDQGRQVRLTWDRSGYDTLDSSQPIIGYGIYREQGPFANLESQAEGTDKLLGWDFLTMVPARGDNVYQLVAPTLCDETIIDGPCMTTFLVSAMTQNPLVFFDSQPDSGYSIDNLAPMAPSGTWVTYSSGINVISWDAPYDEDVDHYLVYRFPASPTRMIAEEKTFRVYDLSLDDTQFPDPQMAWDFIYKISAVDHSGNESPLSKWTDTETSGVETPLSPIAFALHPNVPNPFNPETNIRYELPGQFAVYLDIHDLSGKLVRTLVDGDPTGPGSHVVAWNGKDNHGRSVAAGIYLCRFKAGNFRSSTRMTLLK